MTVRRAVSTPVRFLEIFLGFFNCLLAGVKFPEISSVIVIWNPLASNFMNFMVSIVLFILVHEKMFCHRKQFEDAGLDTPSDSTIAEIRNEFLGEGPDIGPVTFAYVLEGNALLLSTDNESIALSRSRVTAVITTSWGRIKSRN